MKWAMTTNTRTPTRTAFYRSFNQAILGLPVQRSEALRIGDTVSTGYKGISGKTVPPPVNAFTPQVVGGS